MGGLEYKNWIEMSAMEDTIFGRWERAVADNVYIRNGSRTNIGAQTYNTYQHNTTPLKSIGTMLHFVLFSTFGSCFGLLLEKNFHRCFPPSFGHLAKQLQRIRYLEIDQLETRMACGGHVY